MYVWINVIKHNIQFLFNQGKQTGCRMWIWYMRRVQHGCWKLRTRMPNASVLVWDNSGLVLESVGGQMHCFMRRCCSVWAGHGYAGPVAGCLRGFSSALWLELSRFWPVTASCTSGEVAFKGRAQPGLCILLTTSQVSISTIALHGTGENMKQRAIRFWEKWLIQQCPLQEAGDQNERQKLLIGCLSLLCDLMSPPTVYPHDTRPLSCPTHSFVTRVFVILSSLLENRCHALFPTSGACSYSAETSCCWGWHCVLWTGRGGGWEDLEKMTLQSCLYTDRRICGCWNYEQNIKSEIWRKFPTWNIICPSPPLMLFDFGPVSITLLVQHRPCWWIT